ncbi:MAG: hypothetical protein M3M85_02940 [bacterium]|nr:hypothetical protein [bacterium]
MNKKFLAPLVGLVFACLVGMLVYSNMSSEEENYNKIDNPKAALIEYFDLLSAGEYMRALAYHGSGYETLRGWNPTVDANALASLLKYGCEWNGWQCLKIKNIVKEEKISEDEYRYIVQFERTEWTEESEIVFAVGPCCGEEDDGTRRRDFEYVVKNTAQGYLVMYPPVYVP